MHRKKSAMSIGSCMECWEQVSWPLVLVCFCDSQPFGCLGCKGTSFCSRKSSSWLNLYHTSVMPSLLWNPGFLAELMYFIYLMFIGKECVFAMEMHLHPAITYKTAWYYHSESVPLCRLSRYTQLKVSAADRKGSALPWSLTAWGHTDPVGDQRLYIWGSWSIGARTTT